LEYTKATKHRVAEEAIDALKDIKETLSGEDTGLLNIWEEICVQVQYEHSFFWDEYDEIARSIVTDIVSKLKPQTQKAVKPPMA